MKVDDILINKKTQRKWIVIDVSDRYNLATIRDEDMKEMIININSADVDYLPLTTNIT